MSERASVGALVRARRTAMEWSLQRLADAAGCAKGYLSEVENGRRMPPGDEILARIEEALMMETGVLVAAARWERSLSAGGPAVEHEVARLQEDRESARRLVELLRSNAGLDKRGLDKVYGSGELQDLIDRLSPGEKQRPAKAATADAPTALPREVPVINKVAAGYPREFTDLGYPARVADAYVRCPDVEDPDAFAARVVGDSMEPVYREGEVVVFSPSRAPKSGQDCFVRLERDGETTFKRVYFETGEMGEELIRLQPLNSAYPPRVLPREDVAGVYVAVSAIRRIV